jgi:hypothetical protein
MQSFKDSLFLDLTEFTSYMYVMDDEGNISTKATSPSTWAPTTTPAKASTGTFKTNTAVRTSRRMRKTLVEWWKCGDNNKKIED